MAIGLGDGAEIRTPMAVTVIYGLLFATLLTLFFIPVIYSLFDRKEFDQKELEAQSEELPKSTDEGETTYG
jgi:HAE1 family hydrophobic/amphiphilic exporter-1